MRYFLLSYDRRRGELLSTREFGDQDEALKERFRLEADSSDPDVEIVVLGAESYEQLATTHGRYFKTLQQLANG